MKKHILAALMLMFGVCCFADNGFTLISPGESTSLFAEAMSPNGRYLACYLNTWYPGIYDVQTDTYYIADLEGEPCSVNDLGMITCWGDTYDEDTQISDDMPFAMIYDTTGTVTVLPNSYARAMGRGINADGTIVVGFAYGTSYSSHYPCVWKNGEQIFLPLPTEEEVGFSVKRGGQALRVSDDGTVIMGYMTLGAGGPLILWRWNESAGEYEVDPVCANYYQYSSVEIGDEEAEGVNPYYNFLPMGMSHNGKYVSIELCDLYGYVYMGRYDTETGELEVSPSLTGYSEYTPEGVSNDGTIVGWICDWEDVDGYATGYYPVIWRPGSDPKLLADEYPECTELIGLNSESYCRGVDITPDGRYICGVADHYYEEDGDDAYSRDIAWHFDTQAYNEAYGTGIHTATSTLADLTSAALYSLNGARLAAPQKGINIVRTGGKVSKVIYK